ncbi:hypothetical protein CGCF413_v000752 [Colletotrichum fructicola]|nr:hypothetical protein CGCF413_v000752 [Colletotrichum fructicola]
MYRKQENPIASTVAYFTKKASTSTNTALSHHHRRPDRRAFREYTSSSPRASSSPYRPFSRLIALASPPSGRDLIFAGIFQ